MPCAERHTLRSCNQGRSECKRSECGFGLFAEEGGEFKQEEAFHQFRVLRAVFIFVTCGFIAWCVYQVWPVVAVFFN